MVCSKHCIFVALLAASTSSITRIYIYITLRRPHVYNAIWRGEMMRNLFWDFLITKKTKPKGNNKGNWTCFNVAIYIQCVARFFVFDLEWFIDERLLIYKKNLWGFKELIRLPMQIKIYQAGLEKRNIFLEPF